MKRALAVLLLAFSVMFASSLHAAAWDPFGGVTCSGSAANSTVCTDAQKQGNQPGQNPLTGPDGLILKVANIIAVIAGMAAVIIIILSGLRMIQSSGSSEEVAGARRGIIYASVGLVVIVLSRLLVGILLSTL